VPEGFSRPYPKNATPSRCSSEDVAEHAECSIPMVARSLSAQNVAVALLDYGDHEAVESDIEAFSRLARELRIHALMTNAAALQALLAQMAGQFEEQERLAQHLMEVGQRRGGWAASNCRSCLEKLLERKRDI
jgi:hypothetical protein